MKGTWTSRGQETSLVASTCSCVPDDISLCLWVGLESSWDTVSQFGRIHSLSGPTTTLCSPEQPVPQPFSGVLHLEGSGEEQSVGSVAPSSVKHAVPEPAPCSEHVGAQQQGAHSTKKMLSSAIPLHDSQTYCLNKALCSSLKRGEEDEVLILIMQECYLALQIPHQCRWLSGKCL